MDSWALIGSIIGGTIGGAFTFWLGVGYERKRFAKRYRNHLGILLGSPHGGVITFTGKLAEEQLAILERRRTRDNGRKVSNGAAEVAHG